ncbi:MAG: carboxypeptidase-like regulatory domain-containing protein [Flavobacteriaceae bacterium]|nr:carboxypeptidase-like regulatory domain-containing protein [Flavobacteriaceae bacterium]
MKNILIVILMLFCNMGMAQVLIGTVINEQRDPLADVVVVNKNSNQHTHTNATGSFTLPRTNVKDTITFYLLGFETYTEVLGKLDPETVFEVVLKEASISLDQVILVSEINALTKFADVDIKTDPVKSSQEILRKSPRSYYRPACGRGKS